jgi:hypothetical protein
MYIHYVSVILPRNSFHCLRTILQELEPIIPFSSIVLIEPMLSPAGPEYFYDLRRILLKKAYERRDVWSDREQALVALKTRRRTARWHPRVLDLYVVCSSAFSIEQMVIDNAPRRNMLSDRIPVPSMWKFPTTVCHLHVHATRRP